MKDCKFVSLLRVPYTYTDPVLGEKLLAKLDEGGFDSVMFFNTSTHDLICEEKHKEHAAALAPLVAAVKAKGIAVGIDVLSTIGHHMESPDPSLDGMDFLVEETGERNRGTFCPSSPKTADAVERQYRAYAGMDIDFLYIDDDLDYHCNCFCPRCLAEIESRYSVFSENGVPVTRENLLFLRDRADGSVQKKVRSALLDYYRFRVNRIFASIEKAAHAVRSGLTLGMMPCVVGYNGCGQDEWAETLGKGAGRLLVRPGGGLYTDFRPNAVLDKAHSIGRQIRYLPDSALIQSEIENFPQQALRKSSKFMLAEAAAYLGAGCTGTSYSTFSSSPDSAEEAARKLEAAKRFRPFAERVAGEFGGNAPCGIGSYWDKQTFAHPAIAVRSPFEDSFSAVGLPVCYAPENMCAFIVNGASAASLSDERAEEILKKGAMLDADAAEILCARGFGGLIGFKKAKPIERNAAEYMAEHALNPAQGIVRDAHLEFSINGHSEFDRTGCAYTLEKTDGRAQVLCVLRRYDGSEIGISCGIFENEAGGRVCVAGYAAFTWCYSLARTVQLKNIFRWLSKDALPAYVLSPEKVALWQRNTRSGDAGAVILNISLDDLENTEVMFRSGAARAEYTLFDGVRTKNFVLETEPAGGGYVKVRLPALGALCSGCIVLR